MKPSALSGTRNPATDPASTFQLPSAKPAGAEAALCGSASGGGLGWSLMNNPTAATIRTTSAATLARPTSASDASAAAGRARNGDGP
jgi:hypothetical protein